MPKDKDSSMWGFVVRAEVGSSVRVCGKIKSDLGQVKLYCPSTCRGDKIIFEKWFNDYESDGVSLSVAEIVVYGRTAKKTARKLSPELVTLVTIGVVMSAFFITIKLSNRCGKLLEGKAGDEDEEDPENTFQVEVTEIVEEVMSETNTGEREQTETTEVRGGATRVPDTGEQLRKTETGKQTRQTEIIIEVSEPPREQTGISDVLQNPT